MTVSLRIYRERKAFELSAICIQGIVPVRAQGCLEVATTHNLENDKALASDRSLPSSNSPRAGQLVAAVLQRFFSIALRQRPFFSLGEGKNFAGAFLAPRNLSALVQPAKQSSSRFTDRFQSLRSLAVVHTNDSSEGMKKCAPKEFPKTEIDIPRVS